MAVATKLIEFENGLTIYTIGCVVYTIVVLCVEEKSWDGRFNSSIDSTNFLTPCFVVLIHISQILLLFQDKKPHLSHPPPSIWWLTLISHLSTILISDFCSWLLFWLYGCSMFWQKPIPGIACTSKKFSLLYCFYSNNWVDFLSGNGVKRFLVNFLLESFKEMLCSLSTLLVLNSVAPY